MDTAPFTLKLNERDEVVLIDNAGFRQVLGPRETLAEELCRFLEEIDYGDRG